ncbi:glycosyltransferase WbuB [Photobacterium kishitanii]|uniref:glycosyltransferase family 4 protein n=1 Tax=Photobacterium kishitanii TaxID=318456 RepID=UPI000D176D14|nr:glycosyltransferase family 4 protein [Photobacterium kishitanii]PSU95375.1 glycosyltransferase WbuB [Photobacterium kishitanii]
MKILILSFYYSPDLCAGSFRTTALVKQLKENKDIEIEVITTMPNRYSSYKQETSSFEIEDNVSIRRISLPAHKSGMIDQIKSFSIYYKEVMKIIKKDNYDIVFATSSRLFTAFLGARVSKNKKIPLYLDIRDIFVDTLNDVLNPYLAKIVNPLLSVVEKYTFSSAKHINLVSKGFSDYFESRFKNTTYSWFTNGIDSEFLLDDQYHSVIKNKKQILYAGNIGEGQGLHKIIPKLANNIGSDYEILIVGDGGRKDILVKSIVGCNNVTLCEPVNRNELLKLYNNADVLFLHLNDYSAFEKVLPSKIFEYAATGKPVLAGVSGFASEFINSEVDNAEVFYPGDEKMAFSALNKLNLETINRKSFIDKYRRDNIMTEMSNSIVKFGSIND